MADMGGSIPDLALPSDQHSHRMSRSSSSDLSLSDHDFLDSDDGEIVDFPEPSSDSSSQKPEAPTTPRPPLSETAPVLPQELGSKTDEIPDEGEVKSETPHSEPGSTMVASTPDAQSAPAEESTQPSSPSSPRTNLTSTAVESANQSWSWVQEVTKDWVAHFSGRRGRKRLRFIFRLALTFSIVISLAVTVQLLVNNHHHHHHRHHKHHHKHYDPSDAYVQHQLKQYEARIRHLEHTMRESFAHDHRRIQQLEDALARVQRAPVPQPAQNDGVASLQRALGKQLGKLETALQNARAYGTMVNRLEARLETVEKNQGHLTAAVRNLQAASENSRNQSPSLGQSGVAQQLQAQIRELQNNLRSFVQISSKETQALANRVDFDSKELSTIASQLGRLGREFQKLQGAQEDLRDGHKAIRKSLDHQQQKLEQQKKQEHSHTGRQDRGHKHEKTDRKHYRTQFGDDTRYKKKPETVHPKFQQPETETNRHHGKMSDSRHSFSERFGDSISKAADRVTDRVNHSAEDLLGKFLRFLDSMDSM